LATLVFALVSKNWKTLQSSGPFPKRLQS